MWSIAFHPIENILASCAEDKTIKLWNLATGECVTTLFGHEQWVKCVAYSIDGKLLASGSIDRTIKLWNLARGECVNTLLGHLDSVSDISFSSDGKKTS